MVGFAKRGWICQEVNGELAKKSSLDCMVTTVSVVLERKILERYMFNREELPQVGQELVSLKLT